MNAPTDWTSPIIIVAAAVILGALVAYVFAKRKSGPKLGDDLARKDLEAKRDTLIQQLRDLDENASPEEKERLEIETAAVLRELDRHQPSTAEAPVAPKKTAISPAAKGFLWGVGSFAGLAALAYFVMQSATPRQEGGTVTGNTPMQQQQQQPQQPDPMLQQLEAAVQRDPNNLQLRNDLAQAYIERENLMAVFEQTKFVLDRSPNDSRALTFQALVRMAMGERETSVQMLQQATKSDPKNVDSWVALAWVYVQENKIEDAEAMIAEAAKQSPKDAARLQDVFTQMKSHAAMAAQQQTAQGGALPEGHPAIEAPAPASAPAPAGAGDRKVTVTLEIDPAASSKAGVVYVMARNPMGGPPVAVKRVQVAAFPITFDFGAADSMMGQPLPDKFRLEARLDSDGDAATKLPTDPTGIQNDVAPGATVKLALK